MSHFPKPFFKKARKQWYVEIQRRQIALGPDRDEAFKRYHELMRQPESRTVNPSSFPAIVDAFLEWVKKNRSPDTFEWYRYRCERFCQRNPDLRASDLRPFHVQRWVDRYPTLGRTSKRNYVRSMKRCCQWATTRNCVCNTNDVGSPSPVKTGCHSLIQRTSVTFGCDSTASRRVACTCEISSQ